jgi:hypothetical protein
VAASHGVGHTTCALLIPWLAAAEEHPAVFQSPKHCSRESLGSEYVDVAELHGCRTCYFVMLSELCSWTLRGSSGGTCFCTLTILP